MFTLRCVLIFLLISVAGSFCVSLDFLADVYGYLGKESMEQTVMTREMTDGLSPAKSAALGAVNMGIFASSAVGAAALTYVGLNTAAGTPKQISNCKAVFEAGLKTAGAFQIDKFQRKYTKRKGSPSTSIPPRNSSNDAIRKRKPIHQKKATLSFVEALKTTGPSAFREGVEGGVFAGGKIFSVSSAVGVAQAIASVALSGSIGALTPPVAALTAYGIYTLAKQNPTMKSGIDKMSGGACYVADRTFNSLKWALGASAVGNIAKVVNANPKLYCDKSLKQNPAFTMAKGFLPISECPDPLSACVAIYGVYDTIGKPIYEYMCGDGAPPPPEESNTSFEEIRSPEQVNNGYLDSRTLSHGNTKL